MHYSLRQIEIFLAIARCENMTQAANSLAISQSAASEALRNLEQYFDIQLFDRIGKRLKLNEAGRALQPHAQDFIEKAETLEQQLKQQPEISRLNVGATLTIGNYLAVNLIAEFMQQHPSANITLTVDNTTHIADKVSNFELDIGLIEGELHSPVLDITPWRNDELMVFCSPEHPFAKKPLLSDQDLLAATWVLRETGSGTRQTFDNAMYGLLPELDILLELQHTEAIKRAVEANLGISCLSRITLEDAFTRGSLVPLAVPHRDFHRRLFFIQHKDKYPSQGIKAWVALCQHYI